jgi:hypothetical protein
MHGWRDEKIKNMCKLDTFYSSIEFFFIIHMLLYKPSIQIVYDNIIKIIMTIIYKYHTFHVFWKQKYNWRMSYKNS